MARLSEITARKCGINDVIVNRLRVAAALHDIGKIKIPDNIVNKSGELTPEEFEVMETHTTLGFEILKNIKGDLGKMARICALYHHESWDGSGYFGKYTCELPPYLPIVSISDVFVALRCPRVYKAGWNQDKALEYIRQQAGKQFNPALVDIFLELILHDENSARLFAAIK